MILFSDLHGHLNHLQALLAATSGPWLSNGDVLGSGGGNLECLALLAAHGIPCVLGNHEVDLLSIYHLPEAPLAQVQTWPMYLAHAGGHFTHTLFQDGEFQRVHHDEQARDLTVQGEGRPVFIGHTHLPGWWEVTAEGVRWRPVFAEQELALEPGIGYVVNLGSLGEPSGAAHPRYVELAEGRVRWRRL